MARCMNPIETEVAKGNPQQYCDSAWEQAKRGLRKYVPEINGTKTIQENLLAQLPQR